MTSPVPPQDALSDWRLRVCPKCGKPIFPTWALYYACNTRGCGWTGKRTEAPFAKAVP